MEISLSLSLPRDEASVPFVRHVCSDALKKLGVAPDCVSDVEIAVTEACTNVVKHSTDSRAEFAVSVCIDETSCHITVTDQGEGFDHAARSSEVAQESAESGRGISLMHALVDNVKFVSQPDDGTIVHLVKKLELGEDSLSDRLRAGGTTKVGD
jgi:serine/threonine-protein kinase RsbW